MIEITDKDIEYAENLLLQDGMTFDCERRDFIRAMDSCDLLAAPGSGKTTALQAKLCCLSQHLPLPEKQGILVLSHTNNAVDEIKKKLRADCYQLFESPHFIGTIQDFVDKFLAIPYYEQLFKTKVRLIDKNAYKQEVERYMSLRELPGPVFYIYKKYHYVFDFSNINIQRTDDGRKIYTLGMDIEPLTYPKINKWVVEGTADQKHKEIYNFIDQMKCHILKRGVLSYNDCYILANIYLRKYPFVIETLRKRFKYIFIDETQDLKKFQLDLVDKIFDCEACCLQRIGDKNQTIFKHPEKLIEDQWIERNPKTILNSFRLTSAISKIVNPFIVDASPDESGKPRFEINGIRQLENGDIPPHLVLFDNENTEKLLPFFNDRIDYYRLRESQEGKKYGFHIIGWSVKYEKDKGKKLRLNDIFSICNKQSERGLCSYSTLSEFIVMGCRDGNMSDCKISVCRTLVYVLRIFRKVDEEGRYYSKTSMEKSIQNRGTQLFNNYLNFVYQATNLLYLKKYSNCYNVIKEYINNEFSVLFDFSSDHILNKNFCGDDFESELIHTEYDDAYPDIVIGSVHSVKGQTHCATMYVETSFNGYETEHLVKKQNATKKKSKNMFPSPLFQENHQFP